MTEERIKELASVYFDDEREDRILHLIRTVAAEAREEGIDELCQSLSYRLRHGPQAGVALIVEDEAARLKEKGK